MASKKSRKTTKIGKAQARMQFGTLVESLTVEGGVIEVTDYGKTTAVIISYRDYLALVAQAGETHGHTRKLAGSAYLAGDLKTSSVQISESISVSLKMASEDL